MNKVCHLDMTALYGEIPDTTAEIATVDAQTSTAAIE